MILLWKSLIVTSCSSTLIFHLIASVFYYSASFIYFSTSDSSSFILDVSFSFDSLSYSILLHLSYIFAFVSFSLSSFWFTFSRFCSWFVCAFSILLLRDLTSDSKVRTFKFSFLRTSMSYLYLVYSSFIFVLRFSISFYRCSTRVLRLLDWFARGVSSLIFWSFVIY